MKQPNAPAKPGMGSFPQHGVVQSLQEAVNGSTAVDLTLVHTLLDVLNLLKSKGAQMNFPNTEYQKTALQEFQGFENQMKANSAVAQLVPYFVQALTPLGPPPGPPPAASGAS